MNATQELHRVGQSLWLDNITRDLLDQGTLMSDLHNLGTGNNGKTGNDFEGAPVARGNG